MLSTDQKLSVIDEQIDHALESRSKAFAALREQQAILRDLRDKSLLYDAENGFTGDETPFDDDYDAQAEIVKHYEQRWHLACQEENALQEAKNRILYS